MCLIVSSIRDANYTAARITPGHVHVCVRERDLCERASIQTATDNNGDIFSQYYILLMPKPWIPDLWSVAAQKRKKKLYENSCDFWKVRIWKWEKDLRVRREKWPGPGLWSRLLISALGYVSCCCISDSCWWAGWLSVEERRWNWQSHRNSDDISDPRHWSCSGKAKSNSLEARGG